MGDVKTTIDLPDDLVRSLKLRAVEENRRLKDVVADVIRIGLAEPGSSGRSTSRVKLPLIRGGHRAKRDEEATPERVAAILLDQEAERAE
jgi:hypothetical protein